MLFVSSWSIDKATPTNIEDYARRNRGGGKHLLANECSIRIPGPRLIYKDIPKCLAAQRNYIDNLLSSSNSLDALAEMAIQGLGTRNVNFLKARPDLKQKVINYFKANDFSKSSHDGINWLLNRFQDTNNLPLDANLLRSASTPLFQDVGNPDRALQITFNQQAITEGITNFGNVLAELLKDNINIEFEGSVIRAFFVANGLNISDNVTNAWLGNIFKFVNNNGSFLRIDFENIEFRNEFLEIRNEIPLAKLERFIELKNLIERNPWALVEDCARENGLDIANYQQLYNHTLPQSCINRLNNLGSNFQNQPLNTGNAAVANVDYYGVEVTKRPDFNLDGRPDTDAEVYQKYREDFGELASGGKDNFQFSCDVPNNSADTGDITWEFSPYFSQDLTTWNSSNPLTTIFKIEAGANMPGVFDWLTDL
ncbi:hypothetical protein PL371_08830 [Tenacibaculum maritimum]|nr:hypothetical protein [Tenacibaculum maritimum]MDB0611973.1 hypothetical protein [Tenacibaculum maritimum]